MKRPLGEDQKRAVEAAARRALELVPDGALLGLGSGRAATAFASLLAERVREGLRVGVVATSTASERYAREVGLELVELDGVRELDLTVDGADEVAPNLDLLKGLGGALVRERIVAQLSRAQIIVVGNAKLVAGLGAREPLPVEVVPMARGLVTVRLLDLGLTPQVRVGTDDERPFVTDNGNLTIDCTLPEPLSDAAAARALESAVLAIAGVVDTGLFLGTATRVLVGYSDGHVEVREGSRSPGASTGDV